MSHTFAETKRGYGNLWDKAQPTNPHGAALIAKDILDHRNLLQPVEDATDVPWWLVGCWLYRESDLNFSTYLGNGQSLARVTTIVPVGRGPFQSFAQGAIDAIRYEHNARGGGFYKIGKENWTLEYCLWASEEWNGEGYYSTGINSPYVWDWTDLYTSGLYTFDHHFDPNTKENRAGVAAIMLALFSYEPDLQPARIAQEVPAPQPAPQPQPQPKEPPMATPTTVPAPANVDVGAEIAKLIPTIETFITYLPTVATFFPPLAPVVPFVPIIKGILDLILELQSTSHTPQNIADVIVKHLGNVSQDIQRLKAAIPTAPQQQSTGG